MPKVPLSDPTFAGTVVKHRFFTLRIEVNIWAFEKIPLTSAERTSKLNQQVSWSDLQAEFLKCGYNT